ncbi:hypothetical protein HPG69_001487, partial [Diceros bicornis minor]
TGVVNMPLTRMTVVLEPIDAITGKEGVANSCDSRHYTIENEIIDLLLDRIQKVADLSQLQAFLDFCWRVHPIYNNLNHIINRIVSSITASLRFYHDLNIYMTEFHTNLFSIPISTSICPHISQLSLLGKPTITLAVAEITNACSELTKHVTFAV